jgi:cell wall-associated NlpC family hydrolase
MQRFVLGLILDEVGPGLAEILVGLTGVLLLALMLAVAVPLASLGVATPRASLGSAWQLGDVRSIDPDRLEEIPRDQLRIMQQVAAGSSCGLGWHVLAGVADIESRFGRLADHMSSAGAYGYAQFTESTWSAYGAGVPWKTTDSAEQARPVDQRLDSTNYHYALPAMDRYLCALVHETSSGHGPADDLRRILFYYSHRHDTPFDPTDSYVTQVLALAAGYNRGASPPAEAQSGRVVAVARSYLGVPYVFGGTNPAMGLDCSGLVQLVYRQLGLALPRTAQQQFDSSIRIPDDQLRPGDLVFFANTYVDPHDWITHVGIYVGGGMQINAPAEGQAVSIQPVFSGFWGAHYAGAGRVPSA